MGVYQGHKAQEKKQQQFPALKSLLYLCQGAITAIPLKEINTPKKSTINNLTKINNIQTHPWHSISAKKKKILISNGIIPYKDT